MFLLKVSSVLVTTHNLKEQNLHYHDCDSLRAHIIQPKHPVCSLYCANRKNTLPHLKFSIPATNSTVKCIPEKYTLNSDF